MPGSDKVDRGKTMTYVFMYGTLKRQEANHYHLTQEDNGLAVFVGPAHTERKYPLVVATKYNLPFLLWAEGNGQQIHGEVYRIDDRMLNWLDDFEGHPSYYERDRLKVFVTKDKDESVDVPDGKAAKSHEQSLECWAYFLKKFPPHTLKRTTYNEYSNDTVDGKMYLEDGADMIAETRSDMVVRFEQLLLLDNNDNVGKAAARIQDTESAEPRDDDTGPENFYKLLLEDC